MDGIATREDGYLTVQGYQPTPEQRPALRVGLRLATGVCLALVVTGLATRSAGLVLALVPIGALGGWTARHPFDAIWNHGLRHLTGGPALPPTPRPRKYTFRLATVWLLAVGVLLAIGHTTPALALGAVLVAVCALVTVTNICIPSMLFGAWWRWRDRQRTLVSR
jgi:hypothetical protein